MNRLRKDYANSWGFLLHRLDTEWIFTWNCKILIVDVLDYGWALTIDGESVVFDGLLEALDAFTDWENGNPCWW